MNVIEEKQEIEREMRDVKKTIIQLVKFSRGNPDEEEIDPLLQKFGRLQLRHSTYVYRN